MTKLVKAATARKRAGSIKIEELVLQSIVNEINTAVDFGRYAVGTWVDSDSEAYVVGALEGAGYEVTYPHYEYALAKAKDYQLKEPNWFQKLFKIKVYSPDVEVLQSDPEYIRISWAPAEAAPVTG
jgi:hypothetical protein